MCGMQYIAVYSYDVRLISMCGGGRGGQIKAGFYYVNGGGMGVGERWR